MKTAFGVALLVFLLSLAFLPPKDDTDPPGRGDRSGMHLFIDHRTGCHYLGHWGITPRLDRDGKHICTGAT